MPHHPGTSREVEESVAHSNVALQDVLLLVLEQRADSAMDDAFGSTRCARRVQDVNGMVRR